MAGQPIHITSAHQAFIAELVASGEYESASDVMRDALRALQQRRREDMWKLTVLRTRIAAGILALDGADALELDDADEP